MIIDCHAHVYAWPKIKPYPKAKSTFLSAEQQIEIMDSKGVDKAVILPLNNAESPMEFQSFGEILYICEKYPGRFIPFCNLDPRLVEVEGTSSPKRFEYLLEQYKDLGCKGLGEFIPNLRWEDPKVLELLAACEKIGFPVTFHTIAAGCQSYGVIDDVGLPGLETVLKKFPKLRFFGHSLAFWSEISGDITSAEKNSYPQKPIAEGGAVVRLMRKYLNLYGDLSAGSGLNALQRDTDHAWKFIDEFQDRLMLGLDYCSTANDMQHIEWLTQARDDGNISETIYQKIMWKNINEILGLNLEG
jgi:hypothetical protein